MLRILTFPVFRKNRLWSFFVLDGKARLPKELAATLHASSKSGLPNAATAANFDENGDHSAHHGTVDRSRDREAVASALSHKEGGTWVQRLEPWLFATYLKGSEKIKKEWQELEQAPPGTWKSRFAQMGSKLMDQIPPSETFLKNASAHAAAVKRARKHGSSDEASSAESKHECTEEEKCELIYPSCLPREDVEEALVHMLDTNAAYHKRWLILNVMCLPLSAAMAVLPGPNVFVVWNGFRVYSHMQARKGALYLADIIARHEAEDLVKFRPCDELSTIESEDWDELGEDDDGSGYRSDNEEQLPSDLDTWVQEKGPISDKIVKRVCRLFGTPELEAHVSRLRDMAKHQKGATTHRKR